MAKTNYTKVEEAFNEGMIKQTADHLLELTKTGTEAHERNQLLIALSSELKHLKKFKEDIYEKVGLSKKELHQYIDNPESIGPHDWEKIKKIKSELSESRKELEKDFPSVSDEEIVSQQRKHPKTQRFNVKSNWLPLQ